MEARQINSEVLSLFGVTFSSSGCFPRLFRARMRERECVREREREEREHHSRERTKPRARSDEKK